jgi:hypothetical protein
VLALVLNILFLFLAGYPDDCLLGLAIVIPTSGGAAETYGYWMQSSVDGCSRYLQPDWLVAFQLPYV